MDFIRKHYEKILLGVVLIGLVGALGYLPFKISNEKEKLSEMSTGLTRPKVKPLTNLDLTLSEATLKRVSVPVMYDFANTNKLFNPMPWQQTQNKSLVRASSTGPTAVAVTNITPLYLKISLDAVTLSADGAPLYLFGIERQSAPTKEKARKTSAYVKVGEKNPTFYFKEVQGPPTAPTNVVIQLNDTGDTVIVPNDKEKPWKRVDGYAADLRYEVRSAVKNWGNMRTGAILDINGEKYKIIAISKNEVILSASTNDKKWTIKFNSSA